MGAESSPELRFPLIDPSRPAIAGAWIFGWLVEFASDATAIAPDDGAEGPRYLVLNVARLATSIAAPPPEYELVIGM